MLASSHSPGFGAGWPGVLCRGLSVVYSSASNVNSFRVCFRYGIVRWVCSLVHSLAFICLWSCLTFPWWAHVEWTTACKRLLLCLHHQQATMLRTFLWRRGLEARSKACLLWMLVEKLEFLPWLLRWSPNQFGLLWLLNVLTLLPHRWPLHRQYQVFLTHRFLQPQRVHVQGAFLLCCPAQRNLFDHWCWSCWTFASG